MKRENPDYKTLKCPKCGNAKAFREYALTETVQSFLLVNGEPDWQTSSVCDSPNEPQEVRCLDCDTIVWTKEAR